MQIEKMLAPKINKEQEKNIEELAKAVYNEWKKPKFDANKPIPRNLPKIVFTGQVDFRSNSRLRDHLKALRKACKDTYGEHWGVLEFEYLTRFIDVT